LKKEKKMSSIMDSAADIKIYNYKTKTVHTEKGVVIYDTATNIFKCFGNECVETFDKFRYDKNIIQVAPICMGKIYDFTAAEHLIKWMIDKYVDRADGKKRHFKCSNRTIIYLHEPMSPVDVKAYTDLMYMQGYKNIHVISADTNIAGMTPEEAIRNAEEPLGKLDCAIEITKDSPLSMPAMLMKHSKKTAKDGAYPHQKSSIKNRWYLCFLVPAIIRIHFSIGQTAPFSRPLSVSHSSSTVTYLTSPASFSSVTETLGFCPG